MTQETFRKIIPLMPHARGVNFDSHGEPLLNPLLEEMIRESKQANPQVKTSFTTNAQLLSLERAKSILEAGLDAISFSINGCSAEVYEACMSGASFQRMCEHVKAFTECTSFGHFSKTESNACFTSMASNVEQLPKMPQFVRSLGIQKLIVNSLHCYFGEMEEETLYRDDPTIARTQQIYEQTRKKCQELGVQISLPKLYPHRACCRIPPETIAINWSGEVSCCFIMELGYDLEYFFRGEKKVIPSTIFGNVHQEPILQILAKKSYQDFIKRFEMRQPPAYCDECPVGNLLICG